jgi:fluoroquinolone transport system permease protein
MDLFFFVIKNDLKLIFRDKSLYIIFIIPLFIILLCRLGIPGISALVPGLTAYCGLIITALASVAASTPSFLIGFIILDERDENVHTILKILPLPANFILKARVAFMIFIGFLFSFLILVFNSLINFNLFQLVILAVLFSLIPPILTLVIVTFATNKIEAATLYKALSLVLFLPVIAFFIQPQWQYMFGIIPFFWTFNAVHAIANQLMFFLNIAISVITHTLLILCLYRHYKIKI